MHHTKGYPSTVGTGAVFDVCEVVPTTGERGYSPGERRKRQGNTKPVVVTYRTPGERRHFLENDASARKHQSQGGKDQGLPTFQP